MAVNISDIAEYTDAEILKVLRRALIDSAFAQNYSIGGRQLNRATPLQLQKLIEVYESRIQASTDGNGGNIALVNFGERQ